MRTTLIALSAIALVTAPVAVSAKDFVVEHSDLDLTNKRDQKTLKSRINVAAREFCGITTIRTGTLLRDPTEFACVSQITKLANEQMAALIEEQSNKGG